MKKKSKEELMAEIEELQRRLSDLEGALRAVINRGAVSPNEIGTDSSEEVPSTAENSVLDVKEGSETILLVDDNDSVRIAVATLLEMRGYKVFQAEHGARAIEISEGYSDPIHLLLTDMSMPQMGGKELAERLLAKRNDLKVIFMSGDTGAAMFSESDAGHAGKAFLSKPVSFETIHLKIRELLDKKIS